MKHSSRGKSQRGTASRISAGNPVSVVSSSGYGKWQSGAAGCAISQGSADSPVAGSSTPGAGFSHSPSGAPGRTVAKQASQSQKRRRFKNTPSPAAASAPVQPRTSRGGSQPFSSRITSNSSDTAASEGGPAISKQKRKKPALTSRRADVPASGVWNISNKSVLSRKSATAGAGTGSNWSLDHYGQFYKSACDAAARSDQSQDDWSPAVVGDSSTAGHVSNVAVNAQSSCRRRTPDNWTGVPFADSPSRNPPDVNAEEDLWPVTGGCCSPSTQDAYEPGCLSETDDVEPSWMVELREKEGLNQASLQSAVDHVTPESSYFSAEPCTSTDSQGEHSAHSPHSLFRDSLHRDALNIYYSSQEDLSQMTFRLARSGIDESCASDATATLRDVSRECTAPPGLHVTRPLADVSMPGGTSCCDPTPSVAPPPGFGLPRVGQSLDAVGGAAVLPAGPRLLSPVPLAGPPTAAAARPLAYLSPPGFHGQALPTSSDAVSTPDNPSRSTGLSLSGVIADLSRRPLMDTPTESTDTATGSADTPRRPLVNTSRRPFKDTAADSTVTSCRPPVDSAADSTVTSRRPPVDAATDTSGRWSTDTYRRSSTSRVQNAGWRGSDDRHSPPRRRSDQDAMLPRFSRSPRSDCRNAAAGGADSLSWRRRSSPVRRRAASPPPAPDYVYGFKRTSPLSTTPAAGLNQLVERRVGMNRHYRWPDASTSGLSVDRKDTGAWPSLSAAAGRTSSKLQQRDQNDSSISSPSTPSTVGGGGGSSSYDPNHVMWAVLKNKFIDSHCHLDFLFRRDWQGGTLQQYRRAVSTGFARSFAGCIAIFCEPNFWFKRALWSRMLEDEQVWAAFGCHPHHVETYTDESEQLLVSIIKSNPQRVVALGEIGLDYSANNNGKDHDLQKRVFRRQLSIAMDLKLPIVLHVRDAEQDALDIVTEMVPRDYLMHRHCVTSNWSMLQRWRQLFPNCYFGLTPIITNPRAAEARFLACQLPLDRLLLETDAPYFVPHCYLRNRLTGESPSGRVLRWSHPGLAIHVAAELCVLRSLELDWLVGVTAENTRRMYRLPRAQSSQPPSTLDLITDALPDNTAPSDGENDNQHQW